MVQRELSTGAMRRRLSGSSGPAHAGRRGPFRHEEDGQHMSRQQPVRMCVGCRQRAGRVELVRVVAGHGDNGPELAVDVAKTMPGRGAWLHPQADCVSAAVRRRALSTALREPGLIVKPEDLADVVGAGS